jgi:hypothetical protein
MAPTAALASAEPAIRLAELALLAPLKHATPVSHRCFSTATHASKPALTASTTTREAANHATPPVPNAQMDFLAQPVLKDSSHKANVSMHAPPHNSVTRMPSYAAHAPADAQLARDHNRTSAASARMDTISLVATPAKLVAIAAST